MPAYVITAHPNPFRTDLQNYKDIKNQIIESFNDAQQQFLRRHKWTYRRIRNQRNVKISFPYYFGGAEATYFRMLFHNYKLFNYSN